MALKKKEDQSQDSALKIPFSVCAEGESNIKSLHKLTFPSHTSGEKY